MSQSFGEKEVRVKRRDWEGHESGMSDANRVE